MPLAMAPVYAQPVSTPKWEYDSGVMSIDDIPYRTACLFSTNTKYFSNSRDEENLAFCIRYSKADEGGIGIMITTSGHGKKFACGENQNCPVKLKFDSNPSFASPGVLAKDDPGDMIFIDNRSIVGNVRASSKMRIQADTATDGIAVFDFDVRGLNLEPTK